MASKRPFKLTTQEIAVLFWAVGFIICFIVIQDPLMPQWMKFFLVIGFFFSFISTVVPCYMISKYNLNILIDRMEPGWEGWLRITKNRKFAPQIIQTGVLGQEKGLVSGHNADIINRGDFPITTQNGNHVVLKFDLMSHNINLYEAIGWKLIVRKFGFLGANAYKRCIADDKLSNKPKKKDKEDKVDEKK